MYCEIWAVHAGGALSSLPVSHANIVGSSKYGTPLILHEGRSVIYVVRSLVTMPASR
jgi:hypothetical protein